MAKYFNVYLLALTCLVTYTWSQKVCDPLDNALFLGTLPRLVFNVKEVSTQDLQKAPLYQKDWYRSEVRVFGDFSAGDFELSVRFSFLNPMDYFQVVADNGKTYLQLKTGIDRDGPTSSVDDDLSIIPFTLTCTPMNNMSLPKVVYDALIYVDDINDNDPVITNINGRMDIDVSESMPLGVPLATIKAEDRDLNLDHNKTFSLYTHVDKFQINQQTGELTLRRRLDFDTMGDVKYYDVTVQVQDGGPVTVRQTTGTLRVHVHDSDDQGPVFDYPMCWKHRDICSWPKYTTGLQLTKDTPIVTMPVPNKGQGPVDIKAYDLDTSRSKVNFHIASTIPPGSESKFRLDTTKMADGVYKTQIVPLETMTVKEGFEIFLKAEEDTPDKRFVVSMIYFQGQSGTKPSNSGKTTPGKGDAQAEKQTGNDDNDASKTPVENDDEYSDRELALIVVTAILVTLVLCLAIGLVNMCCKSRSFHSKNMHSNGHSPNTGTSAVEFHNVGYHHDNTAM